MARKHAVSRRLNAPSKGGDSHSGSAHTEQRVEQDGRGAGWL